MMTARPVVWIKVKEAGFILFSSLSFFLSFLLEFQLGDNCNQRQWANEWLTTQCTVHGDRWKDRWKDRLIATRIDQLETATIETNERHPPSQSENGNRNAKRRITINEIDRRGSPCRERVLTLLIGCADQLGPSGSLSNTEMGESDRVVVWPNPPYKWTPRCHL